MPKISEHTLELGGLPFRYWESGLSTAHQWCCSMLWPLGLMTGSK